MSASNISSAAPSACVSAPATDGNMPASSDTTSDTMSVSESTVDGSVGGTEPAVVAGPSNRRATPSRAAKGGERWIHEDVKFLWDERRKSPPTVHRKIGMIIGKTDTACRIRMHHLCKDIMHFGYERVFTALRLGIPLPPLPSASSEPKKSPPKKVKSRARRTAAAKQAKQSAAPPRAQSVPATPAPKPAVSSERAYFWGNVRVLEADLPTSVIEALTLQPTKMAGPASVGGVQRMSPVGVPTSTMAALSLQPTKMAGPASVGGVQRMSPVGVPTSNIGKFRLMVTDESSQHGPYSSHDLPQGQFPLSASRFTPMNKPASKAPASKAPVIETPAIKMKLPYHPGKETIPVNADSHMTPEVLREFTRSRYALMFDQTDAVDEDMPDQTDAVDGDMPDQTDAMDEDMPDQTEVSQQEATTTDSSEAKTDLANIARFISQKGGVSAEVKAELLETVKTLMKLAL